MITRLTSKHFPLRHRTRPIVILQSQIHTSSDIVEWTESCEELTPSQRSTFSYTPPCIKVHVCFVRKEPKPKKNFSLQLLFALKLDSKQFYPRVFSLENGPNEKLIGERLEMPSNVDQVCSEPRLILFKVSAIDSVITTF